MLYIEYDILKLTHKRILKEAIKLATPALKTISHCWVLFLSITHNQTFVCGTLTLNPVFFLNLSYEHKNIRIEETSRGQLVTYTRQFLIPYPWNKPIFSHPTQLSSPFILWSNRLLKLPIDSPLTTCLPSLFQSFTTVLVNHYLSRSVLNLSFSSFYPFPRVLSWLLISKTWSMFNSFINSFYPFENLNHILSCPPSL